MDRISNADRLVLLLRQRLAERAKAGRPSHSGPKLQLAPEEASGLDGVHALAAADSIDDRQLGRALIQSLLADEFGADFVNDAKFQQVVDRVVATLGDDGEASALMTRMLSDIKAMR